MVFIFILANLNTFQHELHLKVCSQAGEFRKYTDCLTTQLCSICRADQFVLISIYEVLRAFATYNAGDRASGTLRRLQGEMPSFQGGHSNVAQ